MIGINQLVLAFDDVKKTYSENQVEVKVLRGINFELKPGKTLALTGESGSGKSTVLHIAGGLELPTNGTVRVFGKDLTVMDDAEERDGEREQLVRIIDKMAQSEEKTKLV